jgi:hypothetical protein
MITDLFYKNGIRRVISSPSSLRVAFWWQGTNIDFSIQGELFRIIVPQELDRRFIPINLLTRQMFTAKLWRDYSPLQFK